MTDDDPHGSPLEHTFSAPIGVEVKGDMWPCIEMPDSREIFGTGRSVRVVGTIDDQPITSAFMPTGLGGHMVSTNAKLRAKLGKGIGDVVTVHITRRLG